MASDGAGWERSVTMDTTTIRIICAILAVLLVTVIIVRRRKNA